MANFWNGIIRRIRKSLYMQPIQAKLRLDSIYHTAFQYDYWRN